MTDIQFNSSNQQFHLCNDNISYVMKLLPDGELVQVYVGEKIPNPKDLSYTISTQNRPLSLFSEENNNNYAMQLIRREYPDYGNGDFRIHALEIMQENGSHITCFKYKSHEIFSGKKTLPSLPATYVEDDLEATTLEITLHDPEIDVDCVLSYSIFQDFDAITRNTKFVNHSNTPYHLTKAMSFNLDLPDQDYHMITLAGVWAREREIVRTPLRHGIQGIYSNRGHSSSEHNPFLALVRPNTDEFQGECFGFTLVYSGNHLAEVEADTQGMCRVSVGIHPQGFDWKLTDSFQTPEAILVYSKDGLNKMSQTFHNLLGKRLCRGYWRDKPRPILLNNWEATGMNFSETQILDMAKEGKELGVELFVLDDGWFGGRDHDKRGLGDWFVTDEKKLPSGIAGLSQKMKEIGIDFGLWFEPEMVNEDSQLFREHPDYVLCTPNREKSLGRNQYVLDFSNPEVVDCIYNMMAKLLKEADISYVKWDMNRYITQCYSEKLPKDQQGEVFHRYILGVYALYQKLIDQFPKVLFESCASGGSRFDAGMLFYAPQTWASDDTDAIERTKIQYGTSMLYPTSSIGAHVSVVPNHHNHRVTPFLTRNHVAMFGAFGYELDLSVLCSEEKKVVAEQISYYKMYRSVFQYGKFYRLANPFSENVCSWMSVTEDKSEAMVLYCQILAVPNVMTKFLKCKGLNANQLYSVEGFTETFTGNELMNIGIPIYSDMWAQSLPDFTSKLFHIQSL